jgi:hypothetical protein
MSVHRHLRSKVAQLSHVEALITHQTQPAFNLYAQVGCTLFITIILSQFVTQNGRMMMNNELARSSYGLF